MLDYKVELTQIKINRLEVTVALEKATALQMYSQYSVSVFEPNDATDPTALVKVECTFKDATKKMLVVTCMADLIFTIDPIPENRAAVINQTARDIIQKELTQKVTIILNDMGHKITLAAD